MIFHLSFLVYFCEFSVCFSIPSHPNNKKHRKKTRVLMIDTIWIQNDKKNSAKNKTCVNCLHHDIWTKKVHIMHKKIQVWYTFSEEPLIKILWINTLVKRMQSSAWELMFYFSRMKFSSVMTSVLLFLTVLHTLVYSEIYIFLWVSLNFLLSYPLRLCVFNMNIQQ